jgi:antitoxin component of MazEF toxin-antitoxin module
MGYFLPERANEAIVAVRRDGKSLVITLPKKIIRTLEWKRGDYIAVKAEKGFLKATKVFIDFVMLKART